MYSPLEKVHAFISYRFRMFEEYAGILEMAERQGIAVVNRSVDAWDPLRVPTSELIASLDMRIRTATHVIVLVSDDLARSPCCKLEIDIARRYGKKIIAIYPNGEFGAPMPQALDGAIYRAIGWRGNALERAIRGEYPPEARVFDIAEDVARRQGVARLGGALAVGSVLFATHLERHLELLRTELRSTGLLVPEAEEAAAASWCLAGGLCTLAIGGLLGARGNELLVAGVVGVGIGAGFERMRRAQAEIRRLGPLLEMRRRLTNET